jgi:hypothetical protein
MGRVVKRLAPPNLAYDEDGLLIAVSDFPFSEIDVRLHPVAAVEEQPKEFTGAQGQTAFARLVGWQYQNGKCNPEGLLIRAIVVCWIFLPHLHPLNLTQMANMFGKHKQSMGRWVDDFKREFPGIQNPHMKSVKSQHATTLAERRAKLAEACLLAYRQSVGRGKRKQMARRRKKLR